MLTKSLERLGGVGSRLGLQKLFPEPDRQTGPAGEGTSGTAEFPVTLLAAIQGSRNCYLETAPQTS